MTTIPQDRWYVAAYGREISRELFSRTIATESILFWRTESGPVTAMSDRCVHRRFPLSEAPTRLVGDQVVCGHHGFTSGADGRCVAVPGQARVPRTARLRSYPVVEQDSFVWVFIGDPDRAGRHARPARALARCARLDGGVGDGAAGGALRPAGRQPAGSLS
jgi:phenylpropionate dioxygenase-like ring-hydroxylating dioxygenase large terminal subunit